MASYVPCAMDHDEAFVEVIDFRSDKPRILLKKESMGSEKQISVDPISLREPSNQQQRVMYPPTTSPRIDVMIPLAPRRRTKLVSQSLPSSASSSPRFVAKVPKKRSKKHSHSVSSALHRQDSVALANLDRLQETYLQRSKSCGEGRTSVPPEDFDLWVMKDKPVNVQNKRVDDEYTYHDTTKYSKLDEKVDDNPRKAPDRSDTVEEKFKCKALCLYLPAFGKVKSIKARRQSSDVSQTKESNSGGVAKEFETGRVVSQTKEFETGRVVSQTKEFETGHVVSKRVSLEKFECASMGSSSMFECASMGSSSMIDDDDEETSNLFFDLPLELIKCNINDTDSPVTTGFVFDNEPKMKGVLKNNTSKSSDSSARHVRFSTSSPTSCVTPGMCNGQDDFNPFIYAQSV